jgi:uncharacterized MnhB-related membrane protein
MIKTALILSGAPEMVSEMPLLIESAVNISQTPLYKAIIARSIVLVLHAVNCFVSFQEPVIALAQKEMGVCSCSSGDVIVIASMEKTAYAPGEQIVFNATVENASSGSLSGTTLKVARMSEVQVQGFTRVSIHFSVMATSVLRLRQLIM